ncbi:MAG: ScyD/ScyE family protein [Fibrella sp.]|nr:ScyD/ScyE family protein [Armatimonadota bacterium]
MLKSARRVSVSAGLVALSLSFASLASAQITVQVVMSGLNNPRGLAIGADGGVYITEAGSGAFDPNTGVFDLNAPSVIGVNPVEEFYGTTGSVSRLLGGMQSRVLSGLPSLAGTDGGGATGLQDIVFDGGGVAYGVIGSVGGPAQRAALNASATSKGVTSDPGDLFGRLVRLNFDGVPSVNLADFVVAEGLLNPDQINDVTDINSNPYALTPLVGGGFGVVDAGANTLWNVGTDLTTVTVASVFPTKPNTVTPLPPSYQAVPTSVALGPDGSYFVSQLTGFPFKQGGAEIYNVPAGGGAPTVAFSGFTTIIDLAFGPDGQLYVLQLTQNGLGPESGGVPGPGQLIRVDPNTGTKTLLDVTLPGPPGGLLFSTGMAFDSDGSLYVSNLGVSPGGGQVLRLNGVAAVPEPGSGLLALSIALPVATVIARRRKK